MLAKRTSARNYSENLSIKWKGIWKTDASWHQQVVHRFVQAEKSEFTTIHRSMKSMLLFLSFFPLFLFYRDSTLLTPQAQSARRDSSSVVRFATPVTILWGIRYDRAYPFAHATHTYVCTRTRTFACTKWLAGTASATRVADIIKFCRLPDEVTGEGFAIERVNLYHIERMLVRISEGPWEMPITGWSEGSLRAGMLRITRCLDYRKYVSFHWSILRCFHDGFFISSFNLL